MPGVNMPGVNMPGTPKQERFMRANIARGWKPRVEGPSQAVAQDWLAHDRVKALRRKRRSQKERYDREERGEY
jgi:hypothetical protein